MSQVLLVQLVLLVSVLSAAPEEEQRQEVTLWMQEVLTTQINNSSSLKD